MSKINDAVVIAYTKGYRVLDNGVVKSHMGTLRKTINHGGYEKVNVDIGNSKKFPVPVHKLQAYQKFGEEVFHEDVQVRHLDGDSTNNESDNISIGSASDNAMDKPESLRKSQARRASHSSKDIISVETWLMVDEHQRGGCSYSELSLIFGISKSTLSYHYSQTAKRTALSA